MWAGHEESCLAPVAKRVTQPSLISGVGSRTALQRSTSFRYATCVRVTRRSGARLMLARGVISSQFNRWTILKVGAMTKRIHLKPAEAKNMGLLTKSELKVAGLMPGPTTRPAGSVWQGRSAYHVYRPGDCITWRRGPGPAQRRRQSVSAAVKDLLGNDCVVIDVETTGLCQAAQICEVAMIDTGGSTLLNTLVRPTCSIPAEATAIHGVTDEMVSDAPAGRMWRANMKSCLPGRRLWPITLLLIAGCCSKHMLSMG